MSEMHPLVISKITRNTPKAVLISFEVPIKEKERFRFDAGQYLTLEIKIKEKIVRRSYSICSAVNEGLQIGIKEVPRGIFSTYANRSLRESDRLMVAPPEGRFRFTTSEKPQTISGFGPRCLSVSEGQDIVLGFVNVSITRCSNKLLFLIVLHTLGLGMIF